MARSKKAAVNGKKVRRANDGVALNLRNFVPYQVTFLAGSVSRALGTTMKAKFGLNSAQWRIMAILGTFAPLSTFEIANYTSLEKSAVSRTITELRARSFVASSINPTDKRLVMLRFTPKGKQLYERMAAIALEYEAHLLGYVPEHDAASLAKVIATLREASIRYEASLIS